MDNKVNLDKDTKEWKRTDAPDGGWGWVIVFVVFIGNCLLDGCIGSYGIFYPELLKTFQAGPFVTSMAGSLLPAVYMTLSPIVGSLNLRYGSKKVCFIGGCIGAVGLILASLSQTIAVFMLTFGIIVGIGIGMNYLPGHVITNNYFEKKRGIAGGIVCAGAGFGVFILAPIFQLLLTEYGWRGAMLITSGIFMQLCVCATLMRPLKRKRTIGVEEKCLEAAEIEYSKLEVHNKNKPTNHAKNSDGDQDLKHDLEGNENGEREPMLGTDSNSGTFETKDVDDITTKGDQYIEIKSGSDQELTRYRIHDKIKDPSLRLKVSDRCSSEDTLNVNKKRLNKCTYINMTGKSLQHIPKGYNVSTTMLTDLQKSQFIEPVALIAQSQQLVQEIKLQVEANPENHINVKENLKAWKIVSCDFTIFRDKNYIPLLLGGIFIQMGQFIPNTFVPDYCQTIGLDGKQISIIMAIYGAVNIFGRLSAGCLANTKRFNALWLCNLGMFMCGIGCALFSLCTTFTSLCIYAVGMGYFVGYFPPLQILIMVEHLGIEKLPSSLGFLQMAKGPAALFGPPLAGLVYQYSKDYAMSLGFAAILFFLAAGIQSLVPIITLCSNVIRKGQAGQEIIVE